jgi:hypothetical protein
LCLTRNSYRALIIHISRHHGAHLGQARNKEKDSRAFSEFAVNMRLSIALLFVGSLVLTIGACRSSSPSKAISNAADWTMHGRTNDEQRFSSLNQISEQNVGQLGLVWSRELGTTRGLEATPLVSNGVIYTTGEWSVAYALDARTGEILWTYDPKVPRARARRICCDVVNRGVALYHGKVYVGTLDGRLIALDAKSGRPVWDVVTVDQSKPYAITGAPRIAKGMVLIGNAGSEFGVRGYVSAYDAETGKLVWRTFTVPVDPSRGFESKALERAAKTWHGQWWVAGGGGTPWDSIVYDPQLGLIYTGTGNGTPWHRDLRSPGGGDNLYVASILALRAGRRRVDVALPDHAWRQLGLRRHATAHAGGSRNRRPDTQGYYAGVEERIFLRARSTDRPVHFGEAVRQQRHLGHGYRS